MPYADLSRARIYYETSGPSNGAPLLLIHGFSAQLIAWYPGLLQLLEEAGFWVIKFDNRDAGLSQKFGGINEPTHYELSDMAADAGELLAHLGLESAHVVGMSMGGMIAQQLAVDRPAVVRSLVLMCTAPNTNFHTADPELQELRRQFEPRSREDAIRHYIELEQISGIDGLGEEWFAAFAEQAYDRSYAPDGAARQRVAIDTAPDRTVALKAVTVPVAVVHGRQDRLISYRAGIAMYEAIPQSELHVFSPMGHQLAPRFWESLVRIIRDTAQKATPDDWTKPSA